MEQGWEGRDIGKKGGNDGTGTEGGTEGMLGKGEEGMERGRVAKDGWRERGRQGGRQTDRQADR